VPLPPDAAPPLDGLLPPEAPLPEPELPPLPPEPPEDAPEEPEPLEEPLPDAPPVLVVDAPVVVCVVVEAVELAVVEVGTVSGGAPEVLLLGDPLLHAPSADDAATVAVRAATILRGAIGGRIARSYGSGSIRLPQWGQSFRSFCVS
jgi:hypothetical protein